MLDYICIENCRGCGQFVQRTRDGPISVCRDCWKEHASPVPHVELCDIGVVPVMVASGTTYSGILKKLIYRLKYDKDKTIVDDLVPLTVAAWRSLLQTEPALAQALLVPIPLHWMRFVTRGYNQAEMVAEQVARQCKLKLDVRLLSRRRSTRAQHGLGRDERLQNMASAFRVNRWAGKNPPPVVLVDDIYTSGATIAAAASVLAAHGFTRVFAITAARATLDADRPDA
jgi:ComF family protein